MITAVIVTNASLVSLVYASGIASWLILGCHWCRGLASRLEQRGKA